MRSFGSFLAFALVFALPAGAADVGTPPPVGAPAPAFKLQDQKGAWHTLDEFRGKWLVLYFYPKDGTPGCTKQVCKYRDEIMKLRAADAVRAIQLTSRFPSAHGAPVHIGDPSLIGITNLMQPDEGDAIDVQPDELPVFWACGVTPQLALRAARLPLAVTHAPGAMLITDLPNHTLAAI